ncbi:Hint domain-containing protein [Phaeovulum vinaykumarii]|uniref:Hint domain-containing protein n=1 Tax=Phaeovulum vinaykumarii TaxID=407234 RepID=A0A1N7M4L5_9RHOB|nr:Hint domain-containing protein [Phaeovulum vinaykumarii]SIS81034.1 Hint domain-containing protein [Phaeovulum vinaykumarii]SOC08737.1 Hint domain-containing protein [Phaeovulum vinaykumarii]
MFGLNSARVRGQDEDTTGLWPGTGTDHQSGAGHAEGFIVGTRIATAQGWRAVEAIAPGDLVMTFDHGLAPVQAITRAALWSGQGRCPRSVMPLAVPAGALGNAAALLLLPEQSILLESDLAEAVFGAPFVLVPAAALAGYRGIEPITPHQKIEVIQLRFAEDEVVYANGSGLMRCAGSAAGGLERLLAGERLESYSVLPLNMARVIVKAMIEDARAHQPG